MHNRVAEGRGQPREGVKSAFDLWASKRGTENLPKDIAIYLVRRLCCKTLPRIDKEFRYINYTTVSSVVQSV